MSETTITEHQLQPYFDIEEFMGLCQEKRLGGAVLERILGQWEAWLPLLKDSPRGPEDRSVWPA